MDCSLSIRTFFEKRSIVSRYYGSTVHGSISKNKVGIKDFHNGPKCNVYMRKSLRCLFLGEKVSHKKRVRILYRITLFFIGNSIFAARLELLWFSVKMRLKVASQLLVFLAEFGAKFRKKVVFRESCLSFSIWGSKVAIELLGFSNIWGSNLRKKSCQ